MASFVPEDKTTPNTPVPGVSTPTPDSPVRSAAIVSPSCVPDYELIRRIGGGSYGEVWLARNVMGGYRAIKIVHRVAFQNARPFEREFRGIQNFEPVSRLQENQVDILHVGRGDDYFYYVMEPADDLAGNPTIDPSRYVPKTLKNEQERLGRLPVQSCLTVGVALTAALAHLHQRGLTHRDVKPSNVIFVNGIPKLADIGLVTGIDATVSFVGTEGFIAPEGPGTAQADIYSLGKVLYEISTGKDRQDYPEPPTLLGDLPDREELLELGEVIKKACAQKPSDRYSSAEAMQADLLLLKTGKSVRRTHQLERRLMMMTRIGAVAAAVVTLGIVPYYLAIKEARTARRAQADATARLWGSYLAQAQAGRFSHRQGQRFHGLELLRKAAKIRPELVLRNEAIACLALPDLRVVREWDGLLEPGTTVDIDVEHDRYVRPDTRGDVSIRSLTDDRELFRLPAWRESGIVELSFGPHGRWLVTGSGKACTVWDLERRRPALDLTPIQFRTHAFDDAGRVIAVAQGRGPILVYDLAEGRKIAAITVTNLPYSLRIDPGGRRLAASFTGKREVNIYDLVTGELEQSCLFPGALRHIAWHPDGMTLAAASADRHIYIWDSAAKAVKTTFVGHQADVTDVMFLDQGNWLGSQSWDNTFRLWDTFGQREILRARLPDIGLRMSRDGTMAGYWSLHTRKVGTLELANAHEMRQIHPENSPEDPAVGGAFDSTGKFFATSYTDGVRLWNLATGKQLAFLPIGWTYNLQFTPRGEGLLTGTEAGLQEWPIQFRSETNAIDGSPRLLGRPGLVTQVSISQAGRVACLRDQELHFFDLPADTEETPPTSWGKFARLIQSPDGKWLAAWGRPAEQYQIWQMDTGRLIRKLPGQSGEGFAQFSPDGHFLATGGFEGYQVWETSHWTVAYLVHQQGMVVREFAFSPDSRLLAVAHSETVVQLLDAATGWEMATLEPPEPVPVNWLGFTPDGKKLAATCSSQSTQIWDISLIRHELADLNLDWP